MFLGFGEISRLEKRCRTTIPSSGPNISLGRTAVCLFDVPPPVKVPFSLFLAFRYLKPKRTFVSVITALSVLGVTLGITVLIVVISVMTGFDRSLQRGILGFEPHLRVNTGKIMENWRTVMPLINTIPGVIATAPFVQGPVLLQHEGQVTPGVMRGIDPELEGKILPLKKYVSGSLELASDTAILGGVLADELGVSIGDEITIFAPGNMSGLINEIQRENENPNEKPKTLRELKDDFVIPQPVKVTGIFNSGMNSFDSTFILVPLTNAQELYGLKDGVHGLSVETNDVRTVRQTQEKIIAALNGAALTTSWYDENRQRFDAIRMERHVMFTILMFLIVIAAFGITSTLFTVTWQKRREIGIMKALGATPGQIVWVFLYQGMVVGFFGNLIGLLAGLTAIHYRNPFRDWLASTFRIEVFPAGIYEFEGIPAEVVPHDVTIICVSAFVICSLAALIPAYIASQLDPVEALRYE
jgi:lipoprotein-releasing system permease protein